MGLRNGPESFGIATRLIHWLTALLVIGTLPLGAFVARMEPALSTIWLFGLHKTIGATILALAILRVLWHLTSPPPQVAPSASTRADRLAHLVHRSFYVLLIAVPLAGWIASSATGIDTVIFGRWTLPAIAPPSPLIEEFGFAVHRWAARLLGLLVLLHIGGAVLRTVKGEPGLRRMIRGR